MRYTALAVDYDGTLAHDGRVADSTVAALDRAQRRGIRNLLVTGRELSSLFNAFDRLELFDRVVAENGAVLYDRRTAAVAVVASAPPPAFLTALQEAGIPVSIGHSVVATVRPYERQLSSIIQSLGLDWHLTFNKSAVMALPMRVSKATGFTRALSELAIAANEVVGVGDAENDLPFLKICGLSVAVANALPVVKENVDVVLNAARGEAVEAVIAHLLADELESLRMQSPRHDGQSLT